MQRAFRGLIAAAIGILVAAPAFGANTPQTVYVSVDGKTGYDGAGAPIDPKGNTLLGALKNAGSWPKDRPVIIQLLTTAALAPTIYQTTPEVCSFAIKDVVRTAGNPLTIQGVDDTDGRHLVEILGVSIADVRKHKGLCKGQVQIALEQNLGIKAVASPVAENAVPSDGKNVHPNDLLASLASMETASAGQPNVFAQSDQHSLVRCFRVTQSDGIVFQHLRFKDCWLPAVYAVNSKNITLRDSLIEGSSYAFFAVSAAKKGSGKIDPGNSRGFTIENNVWIQDTSGFGPDKGDKCREVSATENCPGEMWTSIPWGVTHDTLYEYMNGALFGTIDVAGDVSFKGNIVRYAYNGIKMNVSRECGADKNEDCRNATNQNVSVVDNDFAYIRDNPVEPETQAKNWRIHGNDIRNAHAWFSLEDVRTGPIYIWANTGWFDEILPAMNCKDPDANTDPDHNWTRKEKIDFETGDYVPVTKETEPLGCSKGRRGVVLKIGDVKVAKAKQIYIFHNSWRIRAGLAKEGLTGTLHHWNNAIMFTGCGPKGTGDCHVDPVQDPACDPARSYFTAEGLSIVFDCVDQKQAEGANYDFKSDIANQGFPRILRDEPVAPAGKNFDLKFTEPESGKFKLDSGSDAIGAGCRVALKPNSTEVLTCEPVNAGEAKVDVGAFSAGGVRYQAPLPE